MLLAAGREVVSKTSAYDITKLSYRIEVRVTTPRVTDACLCSNFGAENCEDWWLNHH